MSPPGQGIGRHGVLYCAKGRGRRGAGRIATRGSTVTAASPLKLLLRSFHVRHRLQVAAASLLFHLPVLLLPLSALASCGARCWPSLSRTAASRGVCASGGGRGLAGRRSAPSLSQIELAQRVGPAEGVEAVRTTQVQVRALALLLVSISPGLRLGRRRRGPAPSGADRPRPRSRRRPVQPWSRSRCRAAGTPRHCSFVLGDLRAFAASTSRPPFDRHAPTDSADSNDRGRPASESARRPSPARCRVIAGYTMAQVSQNARRTAAQPSSWPDTQRLRPHHLDRAASGSGRRAAGPGAVPPSWSPPRSSPRSTRCRPARHARGTRSTSCGWARWSRGSSSTWRRRRRAACTPACARLRDVGAHHVGHASRPDFFFDPRSPASSASAPPRRRVGAWRRRGRDPSPPRRTPAPLERGTIWSTLPVRLPRSSGRSPEGSRRVWCRGCRRPPQWRRPRRVPSRSRPSPARRGTAP